MVIRVQWLMRLRVILAMCYNFNEKSYFSLNVKAGERSV